MKIRIMTDSTCDLSPELIERYAITVLPLTVTLNGRVYSDDGVALTPDDIFRAVADGADLPKTSAINVNTYREAFTEALMDCDALLHFAISAEFSSCHANALVASEGLPVYCVDTRSLSCGIGILVAVAGDMIADGCEDPAYIAEHCRSLVDKVDCSFVVDRLDYLHKGGRCSMVAMMGANILHLKPCIEVVNGSMVVGRKYRGGYERCLRQYVEDRLRNPDAIDDRRIFVVSTGMDAGHVALLKREVGAIKDFREIVEVRAGSTISSHCGDNTCGVMFLKK